MAGIQDVFIITSGVLSVLKSFLAASTYSYSHVCLAVLELICTSIAFALFFYLGESEDVTGSSRTIFILAFSAAVVIEVIDVLFTLLTVVAYVEAKQNRPMKWIRKTRQKAFVQYIQGILTGLVLHIPYPIVAFARADWETDYFKAGELDANAAPLLFISFILLLFKFTGSIVCIHCCPSVIYFGCDLAVSILWGFCIHYTTGAEESGILTFLFLIVVLQEVECMAEITRLGAWGEALSEGNDDNSDREDGKDIEAVLASP